MQTIFFIVIFFLKLTEAYQNKVTIENVILQSNKDPALQGKNYTFDCSLDITKDDPSQQPKFEFSLYKDDRLLERHASETTTQLFAIESVTKSHSGLYFCQVSYYGSQLIEKKSHTINFNVRGNWTKPILKVSPKQVVVGRIVSLHCEAPKEIPPLKFLFFVDNQSYPIHDTVAEDDISLTYNQTIQDSKQNIAFRCAITGRNSWNTNGLSFSDYVDIEVVDPISNFTLEVFPSNRLNEGDPFNMTCTFTCNLLEAKPEIDITKDNVLLHNTSSISNGKLYGKTFSKNAFVTDKGHYKCKVKFCGVMQYRDAFISVDVLLSTPELWREPNISEVVRGHNITLLCKSDNKLDQVKYTFYRKTATLVTRNVSRNVSARFILTINDNADLEGYKCKAENGNESFPLSPKYSKGLNFTLIVPVSKPELSILQNTSEVLLGTSVKLLCRSPSGTDPIFYSLFKGEKFMKTANGSVVDGVQFNISILQESDYGAYQCKAENRAPNMSKYSEKRNITILVPVSTPQLQILPRISEVIIGEQVTLQCKAENGSLPITYTFFRGNEYLHNITASERQSVTYHLTFHKPENSGKYYCKAENSVPGKGQISNEETITVKDHIKMLTISLGVSLLVLIVIGITICFKCKSHTASSLCHRVSRKLHSDRVPLQIREEATDTTGGDYEVLGESTTSVLHHEGDANGNDVNYAILQLQERNSSSALVREVETDYTNIRPTVQDTSDVDHDYVNCDLSSAPNIRTKATEAEMDSPDYVNCCLQNTSNTEETEDGHSVIYSQVNKKQSKKQ